MLSSPPVLAVLPEQWFVDLSVWRLIAIGVVAMVFVVKGAGWLVDGSAGIAQRIGMPKVVIGATIVALGTTTPEAAVSVLAAWQGKAGLALGNGVGSIIADTGFIFGIGCLLTRLPADRFVLSRQGWVQFGAGVLLIAICYAAFVTQGTTAELARWVGVLFCSLLVVYLVTSVRWSRQHPHGEPHLIAGEDAAIDLPEPRVEDLKSMRVLIVFGLIGLALVILAGDALVQSVSEVAIVWGVPKVVVASTLVAMGTSLPELIVGITAIRKGHAELLVGNIIGADILNVLFVIGAAALAAPLPIIEPGTKCPAIFLLLHLPCMLVMLVLFRLYIFRAVASRAFSRWMGVPLVVMYIAFVIVQYVLST